MKANTRRFFWVMAKALRDSDDTACSSEIFKLR